MKLFIYIRNHKNAAIPGVSRRAEFAKTGADGAVEFSRAPLLGEAAAASASASVHEQSVIVSTVESVTV